MRIEIEHKSVIGSREDQQDAYYASSSGDSAFAVVCDGMGGSVGGAAASQIVVNKFIELMAAKNSVEPYPTFFLRAIDILDESVVSLQKQSGAANCGTTIVAVGIEKGDLYWLSVGDSRLYIIRGNEIVQVTRDHNFALSLGEWTEEELQTADVKTEGHRTDALISFIGMSGVQIFDINDKAFSLQSGDKILLTTDGLTNILENQEMLQILRQTQLPESLNILFEKATQKSDGVQDNTTCVLIKISEGGNQHD